MVDYNKTFFIQSTYGKNNFFLWMLRAALSLSFFGFLLSKSALAVNPKITFTHPPKKILSSEQKKKETPSPDLIKEFMQRNHIASLEQYVAWQKTNLTYSIDPTGDAWAAPQETLVRKSGDCEDLAFLHAEILKTLGYEARVLAFSKGKEGHVFCVFKINGAYNILDNLNYVPIQAPSLEHLARFLAKNDHAEYMLELNFLPRKITPLYQMTRK
jgi:predicted transglutaminase-like cysteine proteinase